MSKTFEIYVYINTHLNRWYINTDLIMVSNVSLFRDVLKLNAASL